MVEEQATSEDLEKKIIDRLVSGVQLTETNDRLTVRISVYCESADEPIVSEDIVACKSLDTKGIEPYIRKFKATEVPRELSLGDIDRENVGYILIVNTEGSRLKENPTKEEQEDINSRIVTINDFEVYPNGMPFLGQPSRDKPLIVRCLHGQALLRVSIFPR